MLKLTECKFPDEECVCFLQEKLPPCHYPVEECMCLCPDLCSCPDPENEEEE